MIKFQDINQFRHALRNVEHRAQFVSMDSDGNAVMNRLATLPTLEYEGTVKIHGCCSSVRIEGDKIIPQSRNQELTVEQDNYGFAKFVLSLPEEFWLSMKAVFGDNIVIHGEWAGKGIQNIVAVNEVDKFWAIFRIEKIDTNNEGGEWLSFRNVDLTKFNQFRVFSIYQFGVEDVTINFNAPANDLARINDLSMAVENECPVGKFFGISGVGEGRVWCCSTSGWQSSKYVFKVKGQAHSKSKVKKLAAVDIEKMANIGAFVDKHISEERLMQAWNYLAENKKPQDETSTGDFIRWVFNDIIKEESDELLASNLTEKELGGAVSKKARNWYLAKVNG